MMSILTILILSLLLVWTDIANTRGKLWYHNLLVVDSYLILLLSSYIGNFNDKSQALLKGEENRVYSV